ncbi:MAG: hypothetical protein AMJ75_10030 [Phycisphaerae bacterium SM1_79]|nr:MAG: hypothetical protein AMJ75_10030 [Phycisphaerae bacterium SM1_79]
MLRRDFIKAAGSMVAFANVLRSNVSPLSAAAASLAVSENKQASMRTEEHKIIINTRTQSAVIEKGFLISLKSKKTGEEFIEGVAVDKAAALQLIYRGGETVAIDESKFGSIVTRQVSSLKAEIVFHSWDGDGVISISVEPQSGDILIEPSAYSSRPGVLGCRWNMAGIRSALQLVAPFFQGIKLKLDDPLIANTHWDWPLYWEAGLAILQSNKGGFWIHTKDNRYRYKALQVGSGAQKNHLGFDTQAYGPIDDNLSAGGLVWRINVFDGDWKVPAELYRVWLWDAYNLQTEEQKRQDWTRDVKFAVSWCPGEENILDAISKKVNPQHCLIHYPNWRTDPYDENYPTYIPSEQAKAFIKKGLSMGFRMMPHFNSVDMDPSNPAYAYLRDFQYRGIDRKDLRGWSWYRGRGLGVPESNASRLNNRDKKVMVKVHPGLSMWRSILGQNILQAARELNLDTVFIDVTLVSHNLHNCFVEATTPTEGMKKIISHVASLGEGLVVGGEGLNEITMQGLSFAQAHLFKSWHSSIDGLERTGGCNLNDFLFGKLCRTFGYSGLSGRNEDHALRMKMHLEHGAIPTVTIRSAKDIESPNTSVKQMLDLAGS